MELDALLCCLTLPLLVAGIAGYFSATNILWFMSLLQSKFCPPRKTFRIMWTLSYVLMGISSAVVWHKIDHFYSTPIILYCTQLAFNSIYCPLFFGLKRLDIALVDIVILDIILAVCIFNFFQVSIIAGILLLPYYGWTLFSTALNADFYRLQLGQQRDPVFFTTNYSPHHLYQSTLAEKGIQGAPTTKPGSFYSYIPDAPPTTSTVSNPENAKLDEPLRIRFGKTPESLYVQ